MPLNEWDDNSTQSVPPLAGGLSTPQPAASPLDSAISTIKNVAANYNPLMLVKSMQDLARTTVVNPAIGALGAAQGLVRSAPEIASDIGNYVNTGKVSTTGLDTATQLATDFSKMHAKPPQTPLGQQFESNLGTMLEDVPMMPMSPRGGVIGNITGLEERRPLVSPSDVRATIGKAQIVGQELKDLPQDFRNAQSGVKRQNILGEDTLGVKAQKTADTIGDIMTKRKMQGLPPVPGVPGALQPTTSLYAVRPEGSPVVSATTNKVPLGKGGIDSVIRDIMPYSSTPTTYELNDLYQSKILEDTPHDSQFIDFRNQKIQQEFPGLSQFDARHAFDLKYPHDESEQKRAEHLNEYATKNGLPTLDQFKDNYDTAVKALQGPFKNYIMKYVGTEKDPLLTQAGKGITMLTRDNIVNSTVPNGSIEKSRRAFNPDMPFGTVQPKLDAKQTELRDLHKQLDDLQTQSTALDRQAQEQGVTAISLPGKKDLLKQIKKLESQIQSKHGDIDNLKLAHDYENIADSSLTMKTAQKMWDEIPVYEKQFYPQLKNIVDNTPNAPVYDINPTSLYSLGLSAVGKGLFDNILTGKMSANELARTPIDKFVVDQTKDRIAQELAEKKASIGRKIAVEDRLKKDLNAIPDSQRFGNVKLLTLDQSTNPDDVLHHLSMETEINDFCAAKGLDSCNYKHLWTGDTRRYTPILDVATGKRFPTTQNAPMTSYIRDVIDGHSKQLIMRDAETGWPVGNIELKNKSDSPGGPTYIVGFATQYRNAQIDPKYRAAFRDVLNAHSNEIRSLGDDSKSGVYDTARTPVRSLAIRAGMKTEDFQRAVAAHPLPRFVLDSDLIALKNKEIPAPTNARQADSINYLRAQQQSLSQQIVELDRDDPDYATHHADLYHQLHDIDLRINRMIDTAAAQDLTGLSPNAQAIRLNGPTEPIPDILASASNNRVRQAYITFLQDLSQEGLDSEDLETNLLGASSHMNPEYMDPQEMGVRTNDELSEVADMLGRHGDAFSEHIHHLNAPPAQPPSFTPEQVDQLARELINVERTDQDHNIQGLQTTRFLLANGQYDHPTFRQLPPGLREQAEEQVHRRFVELSNNLVLERAMQPIPAIRAMADSARVRSAYQDTIQEMANEDLPNMAEHLGVMLRMLDDPDAGQNIRWELRAAQHPERLTQLREMLEAHLDAVNTATHMNEEHAPEAGNEPANETPREAFYRQLGDRVNSSISRLENLGTPEGNLGADIIRNVLMQAATQHDTFANPVRTATLVRDAASIQESQTVRAALYDLANNIMFLHTGNEDQAVEPYSEPTALQQTMQRLQAQTTPHLRDAMGHRQADEVDQTANNIFGRFDHNEVADIIHSLRNGDEVPGNELYQDFSMRQRELLARELQHRLPVPEDEFNFEPDNMHGANQQLPQATQEHREIRQVINDTLERWDDMSQMYNQMLDDGITAGTPIPEIIESLQDHIAGLITDIQVIPGDMGFDLEEQERAISDLEDLHSHLNRISGTPTPAAFGQNQQNRDVVNAYTEPLQLASTPDGHRLMQSTIDQVTDMVNNMFGGGYSVDEIAQSALDQLNTRRNEVAATTPGALRVSRSAYDDYLQLLRRAIDDLGEVIGAIPQPEQGRSLQDLHHMLNDAIGHAMENDEFDPNEYTDEELADMVERNTISRRLNRLTNDERRRLANYIRDHGYDPYNEPD